MKNLFKEAHKLTRKMVEKYTVDYKAQFSINLSYLQEEKTEEVVEVRLQERELAGTEKQKKFASDLLKELNKQILEVEKAMVIAIETQETERYTKMMEKGQVEAYKVIEKITTYLNSLTLAGDVIGFLKARAYWNCRLNFLMRIDNLTYLGDVEEEVEVKEGLLYRMQQELVKIMY